MAAPIDYALAGQDDEPLPSERFPRRELCYRPARRLASRMAATRAKVSKSSVGGKWFRIVRKSIAVDIWQRLVVCCGSSLRSALRGGKTLAGGRWLWSRWGLVWTG